MKEFQFVLSRNVAITDDDNLRIVGCQAQTIGMAMRTAELNNPGFEVVKVLVPMGVMS